MQRKDFENRRTKREREREREREVTMKRKKTVGRRTLEGDGRGKCMPLGEEKIFNPSVRTRVGLLFLPCENHDNVHLKLQRGCDKCLFLLKWSLPSSILKSSQEIPSPEEADVYRNVQACLELQQSYVFREAITPWEKEVISEHYVIIGWFFWIKKVDTHVHHSTCMNQKHLLRFIKSKLRKKPDEVVIFRDGTYLTLKEAFESLDLTR